MDLIGSRGRTKNAYGNSFKMRGSFFFSSYFRKAFMFLRFFLCVWFVSDLLFLD